MASAESSLWQWLRDGWRRAFKGRKIGYTRIENSVSAGVPDTEACLDGQQTWLELKVAIRQKRSDVIKIPHLRDAQVKWLHNRWTVNGRAWLLLRVEGQGRKAVYLIPGNKTRECLEPIREVRLLALSVVSPNATQQQILTAAVG